MCCSASASPVDLLIKETQRRNTFLLYAEAIATTAATAAAAAAEEYEEEQERPGAGDPTVHPAAPAVVGYIFYTATGLNAHISKLAVATEWRRRGIARALVRAAVQSAASERRVCSVSLHVDADNSAALGLYRGEGFESEALLEVGAAAFTWECQLAGQLPAFLPQNLGPPAPPPHHCFSCLSSVACRITTAGDATPIRCALTSQTASKQTHHIQTTASGSEHSRLAAVAASAFGIQRASRGIDSMAEECEEIEIMEEAPAAEAPAVAAAPAAAAVEAAPEATAVEAAPEAAAAQAEPAEAAAPASTEEVSADAAAAASEAAGDGEAAPKSGEPDAASAAGAAAAAKVAETEGAPHLESEAAAEGEPVAAEQAAPTEAEAEAEAPAAAEPAKPSPASNAAQRNLQALHDELLQFAEEVRCLPACLPPCCTLLVHNSRCHNPEKSAAEGQSAQPHSPRIASARSAIPPTGRTHHKRAQAAAAGAGGGQEGL